MTPEHDERPWGSYTVLAEGAGYKVKRITVQAGKRLSYQRHARREEHWVVVGGAGRVTLDGDEFDVALGRGRRCARPGGSSHREHGKRQAARLHRGTTRRLPRRRRHRASRR